jgi:hypothetical protein
MYNRLHRVFLDQSASYLLKEMGLASRKETTPTHTSGEESIGGNVCIAKVG